MTTSAAPIRRWARLTHGSLGAAALSTAALIWRGRADTGSGAAPLNAVTHWLWPLQALQRDDVSARHTMTGLAVHSASSLLWAWLFAELRARRDRPTAANGLVDAAAVTAFASLVDLKMVPERLSPGFEKRLRPHSTFVVYVAFGAGLALAELWSRSRRY